MNIKLITKKFHNFNNMEEKNLKWLLYLKPHVYCQLKFFFILFTRSKKRDSQYATRQYLPDEMRVGFLTENYAITSVSAIEESIHHPYFHQSDMNYDVALLKLKNNIICNKYRNPICLPPANFHPKKNAIFNFAGWGKTCGNPPESKLIVKQRYKEIDIGENMSLQN